MALLSQFDLKFRDLESPLLAMPQKHTPVNYEGFDSPYILKYMPPKV
jgi:hypothetical protein